mmetsp:Transcript_48951/g.138249  ORF Transcript_48951/g.138249 Transcript_48951/m.138249 type:complete len:415 (-) Transcript_48951:1464-2708(-)
MVIPEDAPNFRVLVSDPASVLLQPHRLTPPHRPQRAHAADLIFSGLRVGALDDLVLRVLVGVQKGLLARLVTLQRREEEYRIEVAAGRVVHVVLGEQVLARDVAAPRRQVDWPVALLVPHVRVGAQLQQQREALDRTVARGSVERRVAPPIDVVHVLLVVHDLAQKLHHVRPVNRARDKERRPLLRILAVELDAALPVGAEELERPSVLHQVRGPHAQRVRPLRIAVARCQQQPAAAQRTRRHGGVERRVAVLVGGGARVGRARHEKLGAVQLVVGARVEERVPPDAVGLVDDVRVLSVERRQRRNVPVGGGVVELGHLILALLVAALALALVGLFRVLTVGPRVLELLLGGPAAAWLVDVGLVDVRLVVLGQRVDSARDALACWCRRVAADHVVERALRLEQPAGAPARFPAR